MASILYYFLVSVRNLRNHSASCRETLTHDRKWAYSKNWSQNFETLYKKAGTKNIKVETTLEFDRVNICGTEQGVNDKITALQTH